MRHNLGRRDFLRRAGTGVFVASPIWSWATERQGPPARANEDAAGWVTIPTREHHGDNEERLQIPPSHLGRHGGGHQQIPPRGQCRALPLRRHPAPARRPGRVAGFMKATYPSPAR